MFTTKEEVEEKFGSYHQLILKNNAAFLKVTLVQEENPSSITGIVTD